MRWAANRRFLGKLALITPLLWLGYIASSLAIYFAASWGPIVLESLKFPRDKSALVAQSLLIDSPPAEGEPAFPDD
jgi:hypothetical protein